MTHHPHGPSSLPIQQACPGSYALCKDLPEEESEYAEEGQLLHELMAHPHEARELVELDDEQREALAFCRDFIAAQNIGETAIQLSEQQISALYEDGLTMFTGTVDCVFIVDKTAYLFDYKFGRSIVAKESVKTQNTAYALGLHDTYGVDYVKCFAVFPRLKDVIWFDINDFESYRGLFSAIIESTEDADAALYHGEHCTYCRGKSICPEFKRMTEQLTVASKTLPIKEWTIKQLWQWHDRKKLVDKMADEVDRELKERGETRRGNVNKFISNTSEVYAKVASHLSLDEFLSCGKLSASRMIDLLAQKKIDTHAALFDAAPSKAEAIEWAKAKLGDSYAEEEGQPVLCKRNKEDAR